MSQTIPELRAGWAWCALEDVAEVRLGRQRSPKNHSGENMVPYLRAANVKWTGLDLSDVNEMNFTSNEVDTYALRAGDIVVAEASGSASEVGKPAIWRDELPTCCLQNTLVRVRSKGPVPEYLLLVLREAALGGKFARAAIGVGIHHLGAARLSKWPVALPPIEEQQRIVEAHAELETDLLAGEADLSAAKEIAAQLRLAVLRKAVDGGLVPQREGDEPAHLAIERDVVSGRSHNLKKRSHKSAHDARAGGQP